jgi:hypothetical protein
MSNANATSIAMRCLGSRRVFVASGEAGAGKKS